MSVQIYRRTTTAPGKALLMILGGPKGAVPVHFEVMEGATNAQVRVAALRALLAIYPEQPNGAQAMGLLGVASLTLHTMVRECYTPPPPIESEQETPASSH